MIAFIATLASLAYVAVSLPIARRLYGRWRARKVDEYFDRNKRIYRRSGDELMAESLKDYGVDWPFYMIGAVCLALTWPVVLPVWAVSVAAARWLDGTPVLARAELEAERGQLAARIQQLEAELGIREAS